MPRLPMFLRLARRRRQGFDGRRRFVVQPPWCRSGDRRCASANARRARRSASTAVPEWLLNGPAPPMLGTGENADPALAAPPPAFLCSEHGWVICPLHGYGSAAGVDAVGQSPTSVFDFGSTSAALADVRIVAPRLPSPTPAVVEIEGDALAYVSAPTGASTFTLGSSVRTLTSAPAARPPSPPRVEADAPRLPFPTPATPPPSPRAGARRRLLALGLPLASPSADSPTSSRGRRAGTWSLAALGLANGASNGVAPGTRLPGGSSDEDEEEGGRSAARRW